MGRTAILLLAAFGLVLGAISVAAEPMTPLCKVGEKYDAKIKRCVSG